jgi:predicted Zn-ribbon and HTH transcriptional regulator
MSPAMGGAMGGRRSLVKPQYCVNCVWQAGLPYLLSRCPECNGQIIKGTR